MSSYLARHRTICAVIDEINELAVKRGDFATERLCAEAKQYAQSMSNKLVENKKYWLSLRTDQDNGDQP